MCPPQSAPGLLSPRADVAPQWVNNLTCLPLNRPTQLLLFLPRKTRMSAQQTAALLYLENNFYMLDSTFTRKTYTYVEQNVFT